MNVNNAIESVTSAFGAVITLGIGLVGIFLLVDILFPNATDIVANVAALVDSFVSRGLIGLITLVVLVAILSRD